MENRDKRRSNELRLERRRPEKATGDQSRLEDAKELQRRPDQRRPQETKGYQRGTREYQRKPEVTRGG